MAGALESKPILLMNTHVYPRHSNDHVAPFMHEFAKICSSFARVIVHCPHAPGLAESEHIDGVEIRRFRYTSEAKQTLAYRGDMHKQVFSSPFKAYLFMKFLWKWRKATKQLIQDVQPDIVHAHWLIPGGYVTSKAMKKSKTPLFLSMHGTDVFLVRKRKFAQRIAKKIFSQTRSSHFVSKALQKSIAASCQRKAASDDLILPMFFDFKRFSEIKRKEESKRILFVGRLLSVKGVDVLLDAFSMFHSVGNSENWTLDIVGDGPLLGELQQLANDKNIAENVAFHGSLERDALVEIYGECDLFVLPSRTTSAGEKEGLGVVLLEAMMSRVAVIGTNCGGIPEVIEHQKTGLIVEQDDAHSLFEAIQTLTEDADLRKQLVDQAYAQMTERYSNQSIQLQLKQWYGGRLNGE